MPNIPLVAIVDDDIVLVAILKLLLLNYGIPVAYVANCGLEAVRLFEGSKVKPNVILMDIHIDNSNGIDAARRILAISNNVNIIMLSAVEWLEKESLDAGAKKFISKPANIHTIIQEVSNITEQ